MQNNTLIQKIIFHIEQKKEILPILFVSRDQNLLRGKVQDITTKLTQHFHQDMLNNYVFDRQEQNIKLQELKDFLAPAYEKARDIFQSFSIFGIENMTTQAANASLKLFEEPGVGNIFLLTASSTGLILDTILSRVQIIFLEGEEFFLENEEFSRLFESYVTQGDIEIFSFLSREKIEKDVGILLLDTIIKSCQKNKWYFPFLDTVLEKKYLVQKSTLQPKYVIDAILLEIEK